MAAINHAAESGKFRKKYLKKNSPAVVKQAIKYCRDNKIPWWGWLERADLEVNLAKLPLDEAEAVWLGEARSAIERGDGDSLGFCLQKLRDPTPLIDAIAQLFCGHNPEWILKFARKRGRPKDQRKIIRDFWLSEQVAARTVKQEALIDKLEEDGISRSKIFRAKRRHPRPKQESC